MQKFHSRQSAQIGIVAVLLTTVLLAIGVSVTTRVVDQVAQDTSRTESNQSFNVAESNVDNAAGGNGSSTPVDVDGNRTASHKFNDDNSVHLDAGESVEIKYEPGTSFQYVTWDLPSNCTQDNCPALLLSWYPSDNTNQAFYYPITDGITPGANRNGYTSATRSGSSATFTNGDGNPSVNINGAGILRVKVLYNGTNLIIPGLVTTTRAAAANQAGNEVRVAEQQETTTAAPAVLDFALFAGNGSIGNI